MRCSLAALLCLHLPAQDLQTTSHQLKLENGGLDYTARTGRRPLRDAEGKPIAHVFQVAYLQKNANPRVRPVTFVFNGGPGSPSVWLHMGGLGPRRVELGTDGHALAPSARHKHNPHTWLPFTDLVFVDPVGTGYSRPAEGKTQAEFSGYQEDISSMGDFIAQWLQDHQRWGSPKYLAGESYGTMRCAGLSGYLMDRHKLFLDGILLISTVLDYGTKSFTPGHDLPYALHLPTFAATAFFHDKHGSGHTELEPFLQEVEKFALGAYWSALAQGDQLSEAQAQHVGKRLGTYLGVSEDFVARCRLRINLRRFAKELLRTGGKTVGRLDSRFVGKDKDDAGERYSYDASMANIDGVFQSALHDYCQRQLQYTTDLTYECLSGSVRPWSYESFTNSFVSSAETLRRVMEQNPHMRVLVMSGYYDLATPYFAADYTFSHMGLSKAARKRVQVAYYPAGHMMYIHEPSLVKMTGDAQAFYAARRSGQ